MLVSLAHGERELAALWDELRGLLALPFSGEWGEASLRFSAGVALLSDPGCGSEQVLDAARAALHQAQQAGGARCVPFRSSRLLELRQRVALETELRRALERRDLRVHYQPIMASDTGELRGLEALVRWPHPVRGWLPPDLFIPLAEETGLIHELGEFVLREVLQQRTHWRNAGHALARAQLSLNLSARQLDDERFVCSVERAAGEGELAGAPLWIELTETAPVADGAAACARLQRLRDLGMRVALDDLGTGYASLLELRSLPLDGLKLDRRLTAGVGTEPVSTHLFEAVCALARSIPLCLVAEGIETQAQLAVLRRERCPAAQGFLWSPALSATELEQWNSQRARRTA